MHAWTDDQMRWSRGFIQSDSGGGVTVVERRTDEEFCRLFLHLFFYSFLKAPFITVFACVNESRHASPPATCPPRRVPLFTRRIFARLEKCRLEPRYVNEWTDDQTSLCMNGQMTK